MSLETMTKIGTYTVPAGGVASYTFSNIPQTYTNLVVKVSARTTASEETTSLNISLNGSSSSFTGQYFVSNGGGTFGGTASGWVAYLNGATSTANIFGNSEIVISNYSTNSYKTLTSDSIQENNGSTAYMGFFSNVWTNTSPVTSINFAPSTGSFAEYSTFTLYGVKSMRASAGNSIKATGGAIAFDGTYVTHTFTSSGVFTPTQSIYADYLVVAGGGGGGGGHGGGGGAGGFKTATGFSCASGTGLTVTVGAGGAGGAGNPSTVAGSAGSNSVFSTVTSSGGGGGASANTSAAAGGGGGSGSGGAGGSALSDGQGNAGGSGLAAAGGGGGGAGAAGTNAPSTYNGGAGGNGTANSISGSSVTYAGGGGGAGGVSGSGGLGAAGGTGGGGAGGNPSEPNDGTAGTANRGGGGGGGGYINEGDRGAGGNGGSGIVIIRYKG